MLINNAGISGGERQDIREMDYSRWALTLAVNTISPFRVTVALLDNLRRSRKPRNHYALQPAGLDAASHFNRQLCLPLIKGRGQQSDAGLAVDLRSEKHYHVPRASVGSNRHGWFESRPDRAGSASGLIRLIDRLDCRTLATS